MTKEELLKLTKTTWEPYAGHPISDEEADEIIQNTTALFRLLLDWQQNPINDTSEEIKGGRKGNIRT